MGTIAVTAVAMVLGWAIGLATAGSGVPSFLQASDFRHATMELSDVLVPFLAYFVFAVVVVGVGHTAGRRLGPAIALVVLVLVGGVTQFFWMSLPPMCLERGDACLIATEQSAVSILVPLAGMTLGVCLGVAVGGAARRRLESRGDSGFGSAVS